MDVGDRKFESLKIRNLGVRKSENLVIRESENTQARNFKCPKFGHLVILGIENLETWLVYFSA